MRISLVFAAAAGAFVASRQTPWSVAIEVLLRVVVIYPILIVSMPLWRTSPRTIAGSRGAARALDPAAWDRDAHREQPEAHDVPACSGCGVVVSRREQPPACDRCGISSWVRAAGGPPRRERQAPRSEGRSGARQPPAVSSSAPG
ncbi:hypothetical protein [Sorangium sp. So ce341]|uniref:hypothetical protein n=1 Tax=Sorangium sp. So ce341 TaxID=3133302 RepID=UPI003F61235C